MEHRHWFIVNVTKAMITIHETMNFEVFVDDYYMLLFEPYVEIEIEIKLKINIPKKVINVLMDLFFVG